MQWLIAFILACATFGLYYMIHKKPLYQTEEEKASDFNKSMILFFFIIIIYQIVFYYFDIASIFTGSGKKMEGGESQVDNSNLVRNEILKLSRGEQEALEKELLRSIHQDIHVGHPGF